MSRRPQNEATMSGVWEALGTTERKIEVGRMNGFSGNFSLTNAPLFLWLPVYPGYGYLKNLPSSEFQARVHELFLFSIGSVGGGHVEAGVGEIRCMQGELQSSVCRLLPSARKMEFVYRRQISFLINYKTSFLKRGISEDDCLDNRMTSSTQPLPKKLSSRQMIKISISCRN